MKISLRCALVHICICHICLRSADETGTTAVDIVDGRRRDCYSPKYNSGLIQVLKNFYVVSSF